MAKPNFKTVPMIDTAARSDAPPWQASPAMYLAGRAAIDEADALALSVSRRWGQDRVRLLVGPEWREKFDRQRVKFNRAIWHGDLEDVKREASRMAAAWRTLDKLAGDAGHTPNADADVWEVALTNGSVAAIVRDNDAARHVQAEGRAVTIYTLEEIGRLLDGFPALVKAKQAFPGAAVTAARSITDPLDAFAQAPASLEDEIPF